MPDIPDNTRLTSAQISAAAFSSAVLLQSMKTGDGDFATRMTILMMAVAGILASTASEYDAPPGGLTEIFSDKLKEAIPAITELYLLMEAEHGKGTQESQNMLAFLKQFKSDIVQ